LNHVVVVGASLAGMRAIEHLRANGYAGRITLVGDEPDPPYDRPPLSKDVLVGTATPESTFFRTADQLASLDVELLLGTAAQRLDLASRKLEVDGHRLAFDGLILATGARARTVPGLEPREGVHVLRTLADAVRLRAELVQASHVVVVGAGFIGSEIASSARSLGVGVTVVEQAPAPLARVLGVELGAACAALHTVNGTDVRCSTTVEAIEGRDTVEAVRLSDSSMIDADLVVVGVGVVPNTEWLEGSGLTIGDGVVCDARLSAGPEGVFAAGDVARWDNELFGRQMRVEQWTNAAEQGRHVAAALLEPRASLPFRGANYFWSDQYGVRIQFTGVPEADETLVVEGSIAEGRFGAWYRRDDRLVGALTIGSARLARRSKALIESGSSWTSALQALDA
jgi:NADPH-dependent 2,4-dienoyl-CoA reductase/sulfur reductase-like enzyme